MSPSPLAAPRRLSRSVDRGSSGSSSHRHSPMPPRAGSRDRSSRSRDSNCITGQIEYEAGSYLSYFADPANPPQVGQVYYVALDIAGLGDTCTGAYGSFELSMPSGTAPAISAANPVRCYLKPRTSNTYHERRRQLPAIAAGRPARLLPQPDEHEPAVLAGRPGRRRRGPGPGRVIRAAERHGPVPWRSSSSRTARRTRSWRRACSRSSTRPVRRTSARTNKQIGVVYANPTITWQTTNGNSTVNANFLGYVENNSNPGTAYAELAKADAAGDCTSPVLFNPTIKSNIASLQNPADPDHGHLDDAVPRRRVLLPHRRHGQLRPAGRNVLRQLAVLRHPGLVPQQCRHEPVRPAGRASDHRNRLLERRGVRHLELRHRFVLQPDGLGVERGARAHGHARREPALGASPTARRSRARATCSQTYPTGAKAQIGDADRNTGRRVDVCGLERRWLLGDRPMHGLDERRPGGDGHVHADPEAPAASAPSATSVATAALHARRPQLTRTAARASAQPTDERRVSSASPPGVTRRRPGRCPRSSPRRSDVSTGSSQTKTFRLGPVHATLAANVPKTLSFKLPSSALTGLSDHRGEKLLATLTASNGHGAPARRRRRKSSGSTLTFARSPREVSSGA